MPGVSLPQPRKITKLHGNVEFGVSIAQVAQECCTRTNVARDQQHNFYPGDNYTLCFLWYTGLAKINIHPIDNQQVAICARQQLPQTAKT